MRLCQMLAPSGSVFCYLVLGTILFKTHVLFDQAVAYSIVTFRTVHPSGRNNVVQLWQSSSSSSGGDYLSSLSTLQHPVTSYSAFNDTAVAHSVVTPPEAETVYMTRVPMLTLAAADAIATAAIDAAVTDFRKGVSVVVTVLDATGEILVQKRMDGCPTAIALKLSYTKARTCVHFASSSRAFRTKYTTSGEVAAFVQANAMVTVMDGELLPVAGGVLVRERETGRVVGAVGVSGAAADEDEYLALVGVERGISDESLFATEPESHSCSTL